MRASSDRSVRHRLGRIGALGFLAFVAVASLARPATAEAAEADKPMDKALCADSYRNAQLQRKNGALKRARESLLMCASDRCPSVMQPDCTRWLTEVEAAMPSITFAAKGVDGKDVTNVRVTMDGQPLAENLDGKSISVDPGSHALRFDHGSETSIEQTIIVREGEKARVVSVSWAKPEQASGANEPGTSTSSTPTAAWIVGGAGVASLAAFGILAVHGTSRRSDLEKECFGSCRQDQVDSIKTELVIADVALGVGIVALGVSTYLFLTNGRGTSSEPARGQSRPGTFAFGLAPHKDGGTASFAARF
jgi:hypothetical protein